MLVEQLLQAEVLAQSRRQEQAGIGRQTVVVESYVEPVKAVR